MGKGIESLSLSSLEILDSRIFFFLVIIGKFFGIEIAVELFLESARAQAENHDQGFADVTFDVVLVDVNHRVEF